MSISEFSQRPALNDLNESNEFDRPPLSRLAIVAFAMGSVSLSAALSTILLPLAMLSLGIGIVVVWKLSRDKFVAGSWLAQIGLALSATAIAWSLSARMGTDQYMYEEAGQNAKIFLDTLSDGKTYEALEFKKPEVARQLAGTDLKAYYDALSGEERNSIDEFLKNPQLQAAMAAGPDADWQFEKGVGVSRRAMKTSVNVVMVNRNPQGRFEQLRVRMLRQTGILTDPQKTDTTALWSFEELVSPK